MTSQLKLNFSFYLISSLIACSAVAGVNVVGNGGGWAELQFINQFKNSDTSVAFLLKQDWPVLKNYQSGLVQLLNDFKSQQQIQITFDSNLSSDFVVLDNHLFVNNRILYIDETHPKKIHDIAVLVIYSQLKMISFDFSEGPFYEDFSTVFNHLKVEESGYTSSFESSLLKINDLSYEFDSISKYHVLALEDAQQSYDITELLQQQLPCGEVSQWSFNQWASEKHLNLRSFYADATATCGGEGIVYRLVIQFQIDGSVLIDDQTIRVNLY